MTARLSLPALPDTELLADLCREAANRERLQPHVVEKDFYLTRLLWVPGHDEVRITQFEHLGQLSDLTNNPPKRAAR